MDVQLSPGALGGMVKGCGDLRARQFTEILGATAAKDRSELLDEGRVVRGQVERDVEQCEVSPQRAEYQTAARFAGGGSGIRIRTDD